MVDFLFKIDINKTRQIKFLSLVATEQLTTTKLWNILL